MHLSKLGEILIKTRYRCPAVTWGRRKWKCFVVRGQAEMPCPSGGHAVKAEETRPRGGGRAGISGRNTGANLPVCDSRPG